jgi:nucleoside-diphosphate-sugar epimerase
LGVLGCGWLGLPLADLFLQQGYSVRGSTTSEEKLAILGGQGIIPFRIVLREQGIHGNISAFLKDLEYLIINVPPGLRGNDKKESYVKKMQLLLHHIEAAQVPKVIFVSSTSVYGKYQSGMVTEDTIPIPSSESGKQLLQCETLFRNLPTSKATIVRFGGLIGPKRHPINQLSGRTGLKGGNAPVNLIHQIDCMGILTTIVQKELWGITLNAVFPSHPLKSTYYLKEAKKRSIPPPQFEPNDASIQKTIGSHHPFLQKEYIFKASIER